MTLLDDIRLHLYGEKNNESTKLASENRATVFKDPSPAIDSEPTKTVGGYAFEKGLVDINPSISNDVINIDASKVKIK